VTGNPRLPASPFASDPKQAARFIECVSRELLRGSILPLYDIRGGRVTSCMVDIRPKGSLAKGSESRRRLERHFEKEWIDRGIDRRDTVGVEQLYLVEVVISLIDHAVREVRQIRLIVG
jgi:hypothetical protein